MLVSEQPTKGRTSGRKDRMSKDIISVPMRNGNRITVERGRGYSRVVEDEMEPDEAPHGELQPIVDAYERYGDDSEDWGDSSLDPIND